MRSICGARKGMRGVDGGIVRVVAIGAGHDDAAPLPSVEPLAVSAAGPCFRLLEVALGAEAVALVQRHALAVLEHQRRDVLARVAGGADGAHALRVHGADVLVRIARCAGRP